MREEARETLGSETRPFEGLLGPTIVDGVDEAVPDPDRSPALPRGFLIRPDDLPRPTNLVLRRREHLVREAHLLGVHDLLPDVAEALRFEGFRPEAVIVLEIEEHPVDRLQAVGRGGYHQTRLDVDVAAVCLDIAPYGRREVSRPVGHGDDALAPDDVLDTQDAPGGLDDRDERLACRLTERGQVGFRLRHDEHGDERFGRERAEVPLPVRRPRRVDSRAEFAMPPIRLPEFGPQGPPRRLLLVRGNRVLEIEEDRIGLDGRGFGNHSRIVRWHIQLAPPPHRSTPLLSTTSAGRGRGARCARGRDCSRPGRPGTTSSPASSARYACPAPSHSRRGRPSPRSRRARSIPTRGISRCSHARRLPSDPHRPRTSGSHAIARGPRRRAARAPPRGGTESPGWSRSPGRRQRVPWRIPRTDR